MIETIVGEFPLFTRGMGGVLRADSRSRVIEPGLVPSGPGRPHRSKRVGNLWMPTRGLAKTYESLDIFGGGQMYIKKIKGFPTKGMKYPGGGKQLQLFRGNE